MLQLNPKRYRSLLLGGFQWRQLHFPKVRILPRRTRLEWALVMVLIAYVFICAYIYFSYVQPWIAGDISVRIGADSDRYWDEVKRWNDHDSGSLISLSGNLLGPVSIALLLKNGFLIFCFNVAMLYLALKIAGSIPLVNKAKFGFLVVMSPALIPILATLNKEIFALLAAVLTAKYLYSEKRSSLLLSAAIVISVFARWEQAAILVIALGLSKGVFRNRPKMALALLVAVVTLAVPIAFAMLGIDLSAFDWLLDGGNTIIKLDTIQLAYGFPIVLAPKALMLIAGRLLQPSFLFNGTLAAEIAQDPQQTLFQPLACLAYLIVFGWGLLTKRLNLHRPVAFLGIVTIIVCAASPFIQSRYIYDVYILFCLELARPVSAGVRTPDGKTSEHARKNDPTPVSNQTRNEDLPSESMFYSPNS
jgi:hypothetical protein